MTPCLFCIIMIFVEIMYKKELDMSIGKYRKTNEKPKVVKNIAKENPVVQSIINVPPSKTDPNGSYTGKPRDKFSKPVQDADDL